jgi:hypothetical protein
MSGDMRSRSRHASGPDVVGIRKPASPDLATEVRCGQKDPDRGYRFLSGEYVIPSNMDFPASEVD